MTGKAEQHVIMCAWIQLEQLAHAVQEKEGEILDVHDRLQDAENRVEAEVRTPSLQQKDVQHNFDDVLRSP
jgi:hypothetical protein